MSPASPTLVQKVIAITEALDQAELVHAFGGALALAYCTADPRGTRDIDVNVFLAPEHVDRLRSGLPTAVSMTDKNRRQLVADGQSRLWWDDTPVDIFLSNHPFHDHVEQNRRFVKFAEVEHLPVLACADLAVFKTFFARAKDAVDVAAMVAADAVDLLQLERDTTTLLGDSQDRSEFFALVRSAISDYR